MLHSASRSWIRRFIGLVALLFALQGGTANAQQVVISQIYGGGGNSGATFQRDFIELHNRGASSVSLTNWSIQQASSTGSTWLKQNLSGTIPAGGYFLIATASGVNGVVLPVPADLSFTSPDWAAGAGKVALCSSTTVLTTFSVQNGTNSVEDFVGYGQAALTAGGVGFEGTSGPTGSATLALFRGGAGCTETHNNGADFTTALPAPRNSSTAALVCTATGACCNTLPSYTTSAACTGSYQGNFTQIGAVTYAVSTPANTLIDISPTPTGDGSGVAVTALDNGDTSASTVAISPAFPMYGNLRTSISIAANGFATFLPGTVTGSDSNPTITSTLTPNDFIAPLWDDLIVRTSTVPAIAGARVYTAQKTSPNRFIIQWNKVSTFASSTTTPDNLTFQAILNQDNGNECVHRDRRRRGPGRNLGHEHSAGRRHHRQRREAAHAHDRGLFAASQRRLCSRHVDRLVRYGADGRVRDFGTGIVGRRFAGVRHPGRPGCLVLVPTEQLRAVGPQHVHGDRVRHGARDLRRLRRRPRGL
jgi:hypothetical protein